MKTVEESVFKTIPATDPALMPAIPPGARLFCARIKPQDADMLAILRPNQSGELLRQYIRQPDGAVLLKASNRNSRSYLTSDEELEKTGGVFVILRVEYELPAAFRADFPDYSRAHFPGPRDFLFGGLSSGSGVSVFHSSSSSAPSPQDTAREPQDPRGAGAAMAAPPSDYLTFEEAQNLLKLKRTRMYSLLQTGELEASKVGKLWRIRRAAIDRYLADHVCRLKKR